MGVLGQSKDAGAASIMPVAQAPVPNSGFFQNIGAGFRQAVAGPHSTRNAEAIYQSRYYDQVIKALSEEGEQGVDYVESPVKADSPFYHHVEGERVNPNGTVFVPVKRSFRNPFVSGPSLTKDINPLTGLYLGGDDAEKEQIWAAVQKVRQRKPDFLKGLSREDIEKLATERRQKELQAAQAVTERGGTVGTIGAFIGGAAGSVASLDPENVVGAGFGTAAGKTAARTLIKRSVEGAGVNSAAALVAAPGQVADANSLGQEMTGEDMKHQVLEGAAIGAAFGGAHVVIPATVGKVGETASAVADKLAKNAPAPVRDAVVAASIRAGTIKDHGLLNDWMRSHSPGGIVDTSTPDERAAAHVMLRDTATKETSPLQPGSAGENDHRLDAIAKDLGVELTVSKVPSPAPIQTATVRDRSETASSPRRQSSYVEGITAAEGTGKNPNSSAQGIGQFTKSTWLQYAPKVTDTAGMSESQILALRGDRDIASRAIRAYAADNGRYLRSRGLEDSPGNLSLAHFLGPDGAAKVLEAAPDAAVESILPRKVINANRSVLEGKSASEVVAWAHKRIGASVDMPVARADAVPDADLLDAEDYSEVPYEREMLKPDEVDTDAALMQYKSGGDEFGVTGKLRDVTAWDPIMSGEVLVWQGNDGRRIVVDGHQRVGLAKKLSSEGQHIDLPALVIRESDGITPAQARVLGALRNINLGTGSLLDNARVLRDIPDGASLIRGAENRREIEGLARLNYEAFGAAINGVIDPRIAAEIGRNAADPSTHMAMVGLLARERVHNPAEAATIVRQALADGFGSPDVEQLSLLGSEPQQSLYVPIARILSAAQKRLREEKRTFKVLSQKAGKIEAAGNVLDRAANESKVIGSDEALAIIERTANSAGPVRDALIAAARAELSGARRGDAVNRFLDDLAGIDLRAAARGASENGPLREPSGETRSRDAAKASDEELASGDEPSLFAHAVAAKEAAEPFSDPVGEGAKSQTDLLMHDLRNPETATEPPPADHLFDIPETGFRVTEDGDNPQPLDRIIEEAEADELAAQALKDCLK